jgi:hypothetical protein
MMKTTPARKDTGVLLDRKASAGPDGLSIASPNQTGLPDALKAGVESLSGLALDDVRVHYNSSKPAALQALAYTQGTDIHVAPGEERHLPHEAWHVVQQAQGRVKPTMQMKGGVPVNDDRGLEHEADTLSAKALQMRPAQKEKPDTGNAARQRGLQTPIQRVAVKKTGDDIESYVTTADELATLLEITKESVLQKIGDNVVYMHFDETLLNEFLSESEAEAVGRNTDAILARLSGLYMKYINKKREDFATNVGSIADNTSNTINTKFHNLKAVYAESEAEDNMNVADKWNVALACTLFALLVVRPNFMGARSPEELHGIFRSFESTKAYDEDEIVGKIRLAAGLDFSTDYAGQTVNQLITSLRVGDRGRKIIVDPTAEAHTFALKYDGGAWKRYDNDAPGGTTTIKYGAKRIAATWE